VPNKVKSDVQNCLIIFADIIDSSKYSSVLGTRSYCNDVLKFQQLFKDLAEVYFPTTNQDHYTSIRVYGDEGAVFHISPSVRTDELVYKAVQFSYELKARMELEFFSTDDGDKVPQKMAVGVGIHFEEVALVIEVNEKLTIGLPNTFFDVKRVEGYAINYAKRVETCSRIGKQSQIFLSKEAADFVKNKPIILDVHESKLKGISDNDSVFEVRSAFFSDIPLTKESLNYLTFINHYTSDIEKLNLIRRPWLKSLIVSVMDTVNKNAAFYTEADRVWERMVEFAWREHNENDPILLYLRTLDLKNKEEHLRRVSLLNELLKIYPTFLAAKKELVRALWDLTISHTPTTENIDFIKCTINEFLDKYLELLKESEVEGFKKILEELNSRYIGSSHE